MSSTKKVLFHALVLLGMICMVLSGLVQAENVKILVRGDLIDIQAEDVSLSDILKAFSLKTGIKIETNQQLLEKTSCDFKGLEIDKSIRRLMAKHNHSHVIFYIKDNDGRILVTKIQISGENSIQTIKMRESDSTQVISRLPDDHLLRFERESFKTRFSERKKLISLISVAPMEDDFQGIQIKSVEKNSIFENLGISKGDTIKNINGTPIRSKKDLIDGLTPQLLPSLIRIEREDHNASVEPIYIKLN